MKTPISLYSRLALITSVTLVIGYFVVYAAWSSLTVGEVAPGATITTGLMTKIKDNFDDLDTRVTNLTATVVASSIWSKVGSDINYTAGKVGVGATTGNAELDIQSGIKPHWGIYHDETSEELRFWNGDNRVVIGSTGNVGIGTTSPLAKLDIAGDVLLSGGGNNNRIYGSAKSGNYGMVEIYNGTTGNITLQTTYSSAHINLLPGSSGNVGIGTVNPTEKLEVSGNIKATSFYGIGTNLTALNGSQVTTGTVPIARLGSGTPSSSTYLRGDGTWATVNAGSDCIGVAVGTACGGGKYAGGGIVAMTSDESTTLPWSTAYSTCLGKTTGGFTDWRLPTIDELRILYINRVAIGGFSTGLTGYWSSLEYSSTNAYIIGFYVGNISNLAMTTAYTTRCVRKF